MITIFDAKRSEPASVEGENLKRADLIRFAKTGEPPDHVHEWADLASYGHVEFLGAGQRRRVVLADVRCERCGRIGVRRPGSPIVCEADHGEA